MTSINFDNPYLLLAAIPMLVLVFIPYFIAIRRENKSKSTVISLVLHTLMVGLVVLALAGIHQTTVKTETEVYVVADVSNSTSKNLDTIDGYINNLRKKENLPVNSKLGVVCFGRDYVINTSLGEDFVSVKDSVVDVSATDITSALDYTSGLFSENAIKRIVLITDGKETLSEQSGSLASAIGALEAKNIYVDAIYVNSNLKDGEREVQISGVEYNPSTYLNKESILKILIQSNTDYVSKDDVNDKNDAYIRLYDKSGELKAEASRPLQKGFNTVNIDLDTSVAGIMEYKIVIEAEHDTSDVNNTIEFTQSIHEKLQLLLISKTPADLEKAKSIYGDKVEIYAPLLMKEPEAIPYSLEDLCYYDEFIISDFDIKTIENCTALLANMNIAVSKFGKSLITAGNTFVQNQSDKIYEDFGDMMASEYGSTAEYPKLYCIIIDTSRSMQDASQLIMAKETAIHLLNILNPTDFAMLVTFSGDAELKCWPTPVASKDSIINEINSIQPTQGTVIEAALKAALQIMVDQEFHEKHVMLISDGRDYPDSDPVKVASDLYNEGIITSVVNTNSPEGKVNLEKIKNAGKGKEYYIVSPEDVKDKVSTDIADDITETVIEKDSRVVIDEYDDPLVEGIESLPNVKGYYYSVPKPNATVVFSAEYRKSVTKTLSVPLYTYWNYGNGRVTSISTTLSGDWVSAWNDDENAKEIFRRIAEVNTPSERIDYPFNIDIFRNETETTIEVLPGEINPDIVVEMEIISPSGAVVKESIRYSSGSYRLDIHTGEVGTYKVKISYVFGEEIFDAETSFHISYLPEYDSFELYDPSILYSSIGNSGIVSEDGQIKIKNDEKEIESYFYYFTVPLMASAVVLYVIDIIVRKIKWSDIKSLFKKSKKGGHA